MNPPVIDVRLTIKNTGKGFNDLKKIFTGSKGLDPRPFHCLIPMPIDIWNTEVSTLDYGHEMPDLEEVIYDKKSHGAYRFMSQEEIINYKKDDPEKEKLFEIYGCKNWLEWSLNNWGTSWEALNVEIHDISNNQITVTYQALCGSSWKIFEKISEIFPELTLAMDSYSDELGVSVIAGYAPDFPICFEDAYTGVTEMDIPMQKVSGDLLQFIARFSRYPFGATAFKNLVKNSAKTAKYDA